MYTPVLQTTILATTTTIDGVGTQPVVILKADTNIALDVIIDLLEVYPVNITAAGATVTIVLDLINATTTLLLPDLDIEFTSLLDGSSLGGITLNELPLNLSGTNLNGKIASIGGITIIGGSGTGSISDTDISGGKLAISTTQTPS